MARRGAFGRLPRAAPDLTNTLVALIREANAITDRNYLDAWQKGGKVEGKGVSDTRLLKHFKKRRDALDPDDPLWDEWNNRIAQYDFAINESKMSLKFDQGKISEAQMSDFYGKWAGREDIQQDSEFYRHLLSQEAKWHSAAKAGRSARGSSDKYAAHAAWVDRVLKTQVNGGEIVSSAILEIARRYNALEENAHSLADVKENSDGWGKVMDIIEDGKSDNPEIQGMLDDAIKDIRAFAGNDWEWSQSNINGLLDKADRGYDRLKSNAMNKTERDTWAGRKDGLQYEGHRIKAAKASLRVAAAADTWANALDDCQGNPYCAKGATQKYYDALVKDSKYLVAGQGGVTMGNDDPQQSAMMVETLSQLRTVLDGKEPVAPKGAAGMIGPKPGDTDYKGADVVGPTAAPEQIDIINRYFSNPQGTIASVGNAFNADIRNLDGGGWVSSEPDIDAQGNQRVDGEGNPAFKYTTHPVTEVPFPGLVKVSGVTEFVDPTRPPATMGGGLVIPDHHTVRPTMYVRPEPPTVLTRDEGGNLVNASEGVGLFGVLGGAAATAGGAAAEQGQGYVVLRGVIGPDGTARTQYRTGQGTPDSPYRYNAEPPVNLVDANKQPIQYAKDPRTGVMAPILTATATPRYDSGGKQVGMDYVYDTKPISDGVEKSRKTTPSGNLMLGTFQTQSATSLYQDINTIFASGKPGADARAKAKLTQWTNSMYQLPATDPDRNLALRDMVQLGQVVRLQSEGNFGSSYDDDYAALNNRTPQQSQREKQLRAAGFGSNTLGGGPELDRRLKLLDQLEIAEDRIGAATKGIHEREDLRDKAGVRRDIGRNPWAVQEAELAQAQKDLLNPSISVSNIKIPGFSPLMRSQPGQSAAEQAFAQPGTMGAYGMFPGVTPPPTTAGVPFAAPKPISTAPKSPTYKNNGVTQGGFVSTPGPTTVYKPPASSIALSGPKTGKPPEPPKQETYKAPPKKTYQGHEVSTASGGAEFVWVKSSTGGYKRAFI